MKKNDTYQNFVNYFKKWENAGMTGLCMMGAGFAFLWLGMSYFSYVLAIVLMLGGFGVFLYGSIGRAHESDLTNTIERKRETLTFHELEEDSHFRRRVPKTPEERVFEGYEFREGLLFKKQKSGSLCSSEYTCAKMKFLTDAFYVKALTFSLISDEKSTETYEIPFSVLEDVIVEREKRTLTMGKKQFAAKVCHLCLIYDGGKRLNLPVKDDIYTDKFAEELKRKYLGIK